MKSFQTLKQAAFKQGLAIATAAALAGVAPVAQAVTPAALGTTISPPTYELTANPGETLTKSLQVTNNSSVSQKYSFVVNSFTASGEEGAAAFAPSVSSDLSGWIIVKPTTLDLNPNETGTVTLTIRVPANASPGGHYAVVFASTQPTDTIQGSGIGTAQMIGANVLLRIAGNVVESASVVEFSTSRARVIPGEPIEFTVRVRNTGNVHIKPQGVIEIFRGNVKMDEVVVNPDGANVLPDSIRKFTAMSTKTLPSGTYRAQLVLRYGASQTVSVPAISFLVIGETSLAAIIATILGIFVLILIAALMVNRKKPVIGSKPGRM